jgi:hypothetical protein
MGFNANGTGTRAQNLLQLLTMRTKLPISLAAIAAASCLAACSAAGGPDGTEGTAIQSHPYAQISGEAPAGRIEDIADTLYDQDGTAIRVLSARLISPSGPGIGDVRIQALAPSLASGGTFAFLQGDLARCPKGVGYRVRPVYRITEPPHGESDWRYLLSFVFAKPGRYHLYLLKVDYVEGGQRHWDCVRSDIRVQVVWPKTDPRLIQPPC